MWIEIQLQGLRSLFLLSLPSRECGLKSSYTCHELWEAIVTPFAGVWIEIFTPNSHHDDEDVTPFAGVWIEIRHLRKYINLLLVTPFAGVWIEIYFRHSELTPA